MRFESILSRRSTAAAGLLILVGLVYWPGLGGGFVFDDYPNIVMNLDLHVTTLRLEDWITAILSSPSAAVQRPLAMFTFALNHYFTGLNPWDMKATNVAIHMVNACLVLGVLRALIGACLPDKTSKAVLGLALAGSAFWAVMPINLMAVLLIVQRMESLSHTFVFAGLLLYLNGRNRQLAGKEGWSRILVGLVICPALGVLSKESAVLLPLYAFAVEFFVLRFRSSTGARQTWLIPLYVCVLFIPAVFAVLWLFPRALSSGAWDANRNFNMSERMWTEVRVVVDYFQWSAYPHLGNLSLFHDDYPVTRGAAGRIATWISAAVLVIGSIVAFKVRIKHPLLSLGVAWFLAAQLLTATFLPLELVFEHRNYFASLGVCLVLIDLLVLAWLRVDRASVATACAILIVGFYATITYLRADEWSNPLRFAQTEASKHPESPRATYHLAQTYALLSKGQRNSPFTVAAFDAYERARRVPSAGIAPAQGALLLAVRTGAPLKTEWWREIQSRLRTRPIGPQEMGALAALTSCAVLERCPFPVEEMMETYSAALSKGDHAKILAMYGNYALRILGDTTLTEELWKEAARISPREPQHVISLAKLSIALGNERDTAMYISRLRHMGRFGQYIPAANQLERRAKAAAAASGRRPRND